MDEIDRKLEDFEKIMDKLEERIVLMEIAINNIMNTRPSKIDVNSWKIYGNKGERTAMHVMKCSGGRCEVWTDFDPSWKTKKEDSLSEPLCPVEDKEYEYIASPEELNGRTEYQKGGVIKLGYSKDFPNSGESEKKWPHNMFA